MTRKSDVLELLEKELKKINKQLETRVDIPGTPYRFKTKVQNVERQFKYIDDINAFPTICFYVTNEAKRHIGAGIRYVILTINIRGYVTTNIEDRFNAIDVADNLLEDMEVIVNGLSYLQDGHDLVIEEARILRLVTDEGLFDPQGIAEIIAEIVYQQDVNI